MTSPTLHYVYDPLCGWCYAAEPLVRAAVDAGVPVVLHGGGLWDPAAHATDAKRRSMRETDAHIGRLTGQPFGPASGVGLATAGLAKEAGARAVIVGRDRDRLDEAVAALGGGVRGEQVDAADGEALDAFHVRTGQFEHLVMAASGGLSGDPTRDPGWR